MSKSIEVQNQENSMKLCFSAEQPALPPIWALGFHQVLDASNEPIQIANKFRARKIPCDTFFLNIDFLENHKNFNWSKGSFPNPTEKIRILREKGIKTILRVDSKLNFNENDSIFLEGLKRDYYCKTQDGELIVEESDSGKHVLPNFTSPKVKSWWGHLYRIMYSKNRVAGFWDMTKEPFEIPNTNNSQMTQATIEGLLKLKYHRRPFVAKMISNGSSELHIDGELFIRTLQYRVFQPLFFAENHLVKSDQSIDKNSTQEFTPWIFGDKINDLAKYAIELRYQLLPYIYTTIWQFVENGTPMTKPFSPSNQDIPKNDIAFIFGNHLLISPVLEKGSENQSILLPKGFWYHYWTAEVFDGDQRVEVNTTLSQIPFFVKAGSVIPHYPIFQNCGEKPADELMLHVYFKNGKEYSQLYEDAGDGFNYTKNDFSLKDFEFVGTKKEVVLTQHKKGQWIDTYHTCNVLFYGLPFQPKKSVVDDEDIDFKIIEIAGNPVFIFTVDNNFQKIKLKP